MPDFILVRSAEGSEGEYLAPRELVEAYPERYVVIERDEPADEPQPEPEPEPVEQTS